MIRHIKIDSPLFVILPRKTVKDKKVYINLNTYRNLHHFTNDQAKKKYKEIIGYKLLGRKIQTPVEITYQLFKPRNNKTDKMNFIAITNKYLLDAITELKCWEDDNDDFIKDEYLKPTVYDKGNGRVEVTIKSI